MLFSITGSNDTTRTCPLLFGKAPKSAFPTLDAYTPMLPLPSRRQIPPISIYPYGEFSYGVPPNIDLTFSILQEDFPRKLVERTR